MSGSGAFGGGIHGWATALIAAALAVAALLAACAMPGPPPIAVPAPLTPPKADNVLVLKGERAMLLKRGDLELTRSKSQLGHNPVGLARTAT
ncbi:MAG: hypothetical protein U1E87_06945 [Alphaproteobacteria bacterium]